MRLVFAGTPRFAAVTLEALLQAGHDVALVLTQPDRPAGRGLKPVASDVKTVAVRHGLALSQPVSLKAPEALGQLQGTGATAMVVVAYGLLLPQAVLDNFPLGCLNVHASLLPRWRGAAPIQRAVLAGDAETGVCIMRMEASLDTGPVYQREVTSIARDETAGSLHDRLALIGARAAVAVLQRLDADPVVSLAQCATGITYAAKVTRADAALHWAEPARQLDRVVRAFNPAPGAHACLGATGVKIWKAVAEADAAGVDSVPGRIIGVAAAGVRVACGDGSVLAILELQREGGRRMSATEFLRGYALHEGDRFTDGTA